MVYSPMMLKILQAYFAISLAALGDAVEAPQ
jgi:hypothetical protein